MDFLEAFYRGEIEYEAGHPRKLRIHRLGLKG
jgi:hypothetical protein